MWPEPRSILSTRAAFRVSRCINTDTSIYRKCTLGIWRFIARKIWQAEGAAWTRTPKRRKHKKFGSSHLKTKSGLSTVTWDRRRVLTSASYYPDTWKHVYLYVLLMETCFKHGKTFETFKRVWQNVFKPYMNEQHIWTCIRILVFCKTSVWQPVCFTL
jgi:hypothetical protein